MDIAINELSFRLSDSIGDVELLRELIRVLIAVKDRVAHCDRDKVRVRVTELWREPRRLPGGATIGDARRKLDDVERGLCDFFFTDYPSFPVDEPAVFFWGDVPAHGLGYAHKHGFVSVSLAVGECRVDELWVDSRRGDVASGHVSNAWRLQLARRHVQAMSRHVLVMPEYVDPGHHDPKRLEYVSGKSHLPGGARGLYRYAQRDEEATEATWWTKCECNFFHRFQGGDPVHWNGTTNPQALRPTPENQVPQGVRKYWRSRTGVADCGCR